MAAFERAERAEVRKAARLWRDVVLERSGGYCEACGVLAFYITDVHHVVPVSEGGLSWPEDLIALCANCHRWVTAHRRYRDDIRVTAVEECIERVYPPEVATFLFRLADSRVALDDNGGWYSWGVV